MLGGSADGSGTPIAIPVTRASAPSTTSRYAKQAPVAPLRGLKQADLLVVAPFSLSPKVQAAVARQVAYTGRQSVFAPHRTRQGWRPGTRPASHAANGTAAAGSTYCMTCSYSLAAVS